MSRYHINSMQIVLVDHKPKYETGDYINGKLVISLNGDLLLSNIKISLICLAEVKWTEQPGLKSEGHAYHLKRKYLEYTHELPQEICGNYFEDGLNEIPFKFHLPESGIPSSFTGNYGYIGYFIEANVDEPIIDESAKTVMQVVVEAPFRDNLFLSVGGSTEKKVGLLFFGTGNVCMYATIYKKGHAPGELLELQCTVENKSSVNVTPRATLYQTQIYMTGERHKTIEASLTDPSIGTTVEAGVTSEDVISVFIPEDVPLSIKCPIITVKYFIHVTLDIPHAIDLHLNLPIVITNRHALNSFP